MANITTTISKAHLSAICADAISELERDVRMDPNFPENLPYHSEEEHEDAVKIFRAINDHGRATGTTIFQEEFASFVVAANKPGNIVAARIELVRAMTMLLRISCHLNDYVPHRATEGTETYHPNLDGLAEPIGLAMEVQP